MCAINGFNFKDESLILKMNAATKHRGPDSSGVFLDEKISLGHNRLRIIDLSSSASQPMEDLERRFVLVFNGEIYNFKELKKELAGFYNFRTESDTEVILAAYKKWGKEFVSRLNGIFAFAIFDKTNGELFLARDQIGIKPLYYFFDGKRFIFSSEIKAILEHNMPHKLNREAFSHYFRALYAPEPLTMFDGIFKFPKAHSAVFKDKKLKFTKYWDTKNNSYFNQPINVVASNLRKQVVASVEKQLVSDRPIGLYLSGGIDSSATLDAMHSLRGDINTFSVGFQLSNPEDEKKFNADFYLARRTANFYGTRHHEVVVQPNDAISFFESIAWHLDEPIANSTAIPMMKLARFTKSCGVDVVLGGDGGDELFGGYERYRLSLIASYYQKLPRILRYFGSKSSFIKKLNTPAGVERFALFMFQKNETIERVLNKEFFDFEISKKFFYNKYFSSNTRQNFEELFMNVDRETWLVDESLMRSDKMAMSAAVEARVPLLDKDLVEFAARVPLKYKVSLFDTKIILKRAFRGHIPDFLLSQPKRGWFSPAAKWLRDPAVYTLAKMVLSPDYYKETNALFNWQNIREMLVMHERGEKYNLTMLWALMVFQSWAKIYKIEL